MTREEVKQEVAGILREAYLRDLRNNDGSFDSEELSEKILSFLDDIGYDASEELLREASKTAFQYFREQR